MYDYMTFYPKDYIKTRRYPLLVFLHGAPQRGKDLKLICSEGLPRELQSKQLSLPMLVIAPQCPDAESWKAELIYESIKHFANNNLIDIQKIYMTGFSMGGYGTLFFIKKYQNFIAAAAPVCSGGSYFIPYDLADTPLWFFHGKLDKIIEFHKTEKLVNELKRIHADVKFTIYEDLGHDVWTPAYKNKELYDWFLSYSNPRAAFKI